MATLLLMPAIASGDTEAVLSSWAVPVGTEFRTAQTLVVVETAKAVVDVEAETDGVLLGTLVDEGADVKVGDAIAVIGAPGEAVTDLDRVLAELGVSDGVVGTPAPVADESASAVPAATPPASPAASATQAVPATPAAPAPQASAVAQASVAPSSERVFASPFARRLAREAQLELDEIAGSGPNGRITRRDVQEALARRHDRSASPAPAAGAAPPPLAAPPTAAASGDSAEYTEEPHTRLRKVIARRLTESVTTAPHFTLSGVADVGRLLRLRTEINDAAGVKISVNDLIVKAVAGAHTEIPAMNVIWTVDALRRFTSVDVALAVATPTGLVTPVLRGVNSLSVGAIAAASRDLAERARAGRLQQDELEGGSITVSNLGMYGTREFSAIINPPHASILAVGAATQEPVVRDGTMTVASLVRLTVSVDHRPVDGATAAEWMRALVAQLENPLGLLV